MRCGAVVAWCRGGTPLRPRGVPGAREGRHTRAHSTCSAPARLQQRGWCLCRCETRCQTGCLPSQVPVPANQVLAIKEGLPVQQAATHYAGAHGFPALRGPRSGPAVLALGCSHSDGLGSLGRVFPILPHACCCCMPPPQLLSRCMPPASSSPSLPPRRSAAGAAHRRAAAHRRRVAGARLRAAGRRARRPRGLAVPQPPGDRRHRCVWLLGGCCCLWV